MVIGPRDLEIILDASIVTVQDRSDLERMVPVASTSHCEYSPPPWSLNSMQSYVGEGVEAIWTAQEAIKSISRAEKMLQLAGKHSVLRDRIHRQLLFMASNTDEGSNFFGSNNPAGSEGMFDGIGRSSVDSLLFQLAGVRQNLEELGPW
eukprot:gene15037-21108_t